VNAVPGIPLEERRRRLAIRHALAPPHRVATAAEAAGSVVALHATDPTSVFLGFRARLRETTPADLQRELYDVRSVIRLLAMRRTMFMVPVPDVPLVHAAATREVAERERRRLVARLEEHGVAPDGERWLSDVMDATVAVIERLGEPVSTEISAEEPRLRERILLAQGKAYEGWQAVSVWVLQQLSAEGRIVRTRPRGSWISSQYRWASMEAWLGHRIPRLPADDSRVELVRRWLTRFGPGTEADLAWWTGWTLRDLRRALSALPVAMVDLDGRPGLALADDLEPTADPGRWTAFLPALDSTTMGWQAREWYLGPHRAPLFDVNGNAGPTIWQDGRVVGGWAQRRDGAVTVRLLEDVGAERAVEVDAEAERLRTWLGDVRFTPRFPTALERELRA
jgi:hypothetical protein